MAMKSIQDWIQEIMAKNQTQQELPKAEEAFPTTDYVGQVGTRPEITTVPTDVELKATYSPMSALGVGIGHILKNMQQVKALNEQQAIKNYEAKIKAAQDKEAKQAEAQTQAKMLGYREQLPSSQAELKSRGIVDVGNLQKIQQNEQMFPLDIEAKRAQINRINQLAKQIGAPVAGKPPTAAQIKEKDRSEFGRIMNENKDIMGNYPSIPEAEKDIATKAILKDPSLLQNELIRKAAGLYTIVDIGNLQKIQQKEEMFPLNKQAKLAEINKINKLASMVGVKPAKVTAQDIKIRDREEFGRIMKENENIMGNYPSIPEAQKDIATKAILKDPNLLQNELIRKAVGFYTKEDKLNYEEEKEMRRIQGQIKGAEGVSATPTQPAGQETEEQKKARIKESIRNLLK